MPYIQARHRQELDDLIDQLADRIIGQSRQHEDPGAFAGLLNYACTRLTLQIVRRRFGRLRYWLIAIICGTSKNIADEFYRRLAAAYEDKQMALSGDVDLFQEYLEEIEKM
ncbi:MAG: hypothetical protein PHX53_01285 [Syntrophales bacterium]|nr:hypothetical protein [Syntrophales bacterium]